MLEGLDVPVPSSLVEVAQSECSITEAAGTVAGYIVDLKLKVSIPKVALDPQRSEAWKLGDHFSQAVEFNWNIYLEKYWATLKLNSMMIPHPLLDMRETLINDCLALPAKRGWIWGPCCMKRARTK